AKRTVYNNYLEKDALFTEIVAVVTAMAERFAQDLRVELAQDSITAANLADTLHDLGRRLALGVLRPQVIAFRRLLMGEARIFPDPARSYYDGAPGQVIDALSSGFRSLSDRGVLRVADADRAAEQFAYLVVGAPLDRAVLAGAAPAERDVVACARDG